MADDKLDGEDKIRNFAPEEKDAVKEGDALIRKARTLEELSESSDRSLKHVSEHLDQIEAEINARANKKSSD